MKTVTRVLALFCVFLTQVLSGQTACIINNQPSIQVIQSLYFGGLLVNPEGGSITLTSDGALIPVSPGVQPGAQPPSFEARFRLTGPPKATFTIRLDPALPILRGSRGDAIRIAEFYPSMPNYQGTFDGSGEAEFKLGGRLDVPANVQPALFIVSPVQLHLSLSSGPEPKTTTAPFSISALLRAPLKLTNLGSLDFGALIPGTTSGDFEVLPSGNHQSLDANGPTHIKSNPHPASFSLQGPTGTCFSVRLPKTVLLNGPGSHMRVHDFTSDAPAHGVLPSGGLNFNVGGRITVDPDQAYGRYRGTFMVQVDYQ
jgi:hypothetical protein